MRFRTLIVPLIAVPLLLLAGCVNKALPRVPEQLDAAAASPSLAGFDRVSWEAGRADLQQEFLDHIYGALPAPEPARILSHDVIEAQAFDGLGRIEQYTLDLSGSETHLVVILPNHGGAPFPTIILQMFCGNRTALGGRLDIAAPTTAYAPDCDTGLQGLPTRTIFGRYIMEPPLTEILSHGYAIALIYPGDFVPDDASGAAERLAALVPGQPSGAIGAWAWVYSRAVDVLDSDDRFDNARTAVWGHSRNGKAALLAGALDPRIDLVIAHQAGTGGTALTRTGVGEPVSAITEDYPHWFVPAYAAYASHPTDIPIDQHQLIALMAPRPLLIGGAWRDQWSDPQSSFRAAEGASSIYRLYGSAGLTQAGLGDFDPAADLAVAMRPGLHGVQPADWENFLAFLDAHFATH
ncbi:hypothetical protein [uncultured Maricaulis sp.]|uniref:glucuronyl esterase domain-containing protein n=1 Tax=uncultured Maricaulis sp. TaxID=174710 RepID=UPI0030D733B8|tara:strand:+ start:37631 stop:38854 length:1224 start_codon:yes stop_codon:yes gene_type:complete